MTIKFSRVKNKNKKQLQESDAQESKRSSQLSSCSRQRHKQETKCTLATRESNGEEDNKYNGASTTGACGPPEFEYVTGMLSRRGVGDKSTATVSFNNHKWLSSIFHHLEQNYPTSISTVSSVSNVQDNNNQLDLRWNQRLLFDLVNEILGEILKPSVVQNYNHHGSNLGSEFIVEAACKRIRSFPCANCEVLEDIDGLIEKEDLGKMMKEGLDWKEEGGEGLVEEIEGYLVEMLVHEAVVACGVV